METASNPDWDVAKLKLQPQSIEAERSVIGALLISSDSWDGVAEVVAASDFYRPEHRAIFRQIALLVDRGEPVDVVTVSDRLLATGELDAAGGHTYLAELAEQTPTASNVRAYGKAVRERSVLRQLINAAQDIASAGFNPEGRSSEELVDEAERLIMQISESGQKAGGPQGMEGLLKGAIDRIEELYNTGGDITGLTTGFIDLDRMTSGLQPSDLVIVAGRPSMGKTSFAMNLVENAALASDRPLMVFSMEMPAEQLVIRMLSSLGRIDQSRVRTGKLEQDDWPKLASATEKLKGTQVFIDDTPALTPTELRSRVRKLVREQGDLGMIMVDYLQLMRVAGSGEGRTAEISEISRSLKAIAKEFKVPVVALSQLNRSLEQRPNKRPVNSDLRESGAIEQDADVIMFIYRDEVYNEDSPDKGVAEIIIGKQRNGPIGSCRLSFQGQFTRFENLARGDYEHYGA
ncbi:replicative DNA helicase [Candidatus Paraluminiphilus aquimaris]|jgi:replicative DNA helicase|uniref:Replicative DNA helicase n=1 Tax=Candidatus Paraluminiphilus aquimaris TaxID=2518994 RepID=A0ABY6Q528_9GAMM|nr:replicative DNA helicase [Candidatus Paraluminiphilus aquimaris]UZP74048.1 replicative DNA helicase [Candidatus Paraluminiphilus aquimaris]